MADRPLETASQSRKLTRFAIDPVTRVEGHGKVTLLLSAITWRAQRQWTCWPAT